MENNIKKQAEDLLPEKSMLIWNELTEALNSLYDTDRLWDKGFGDWKIEYKYHRGGKTLCTLMQKRGVLSF